MVLKLWTVQSKEVLDIIEKEGVYRPDFEKSEYPKERPQLNDLYDFFLNAFNANNKTDCSGLVFCFMRGNSKGLIPIDDYEDFKAFITSSRQVLESLWKNFCTKDKVLICFEKEISFNPLILDLNDFQYMMPPVHDLPEFPSNYYDYLVYRISSGQDVESVYPSNVLQAHVADIKKEDIVSVYPLFDLDGYRLWTIKDYGIGRFIEAAPPKIGYMGRTFYGVRYMCGVCGSYMLKSNVAGENKRIAMVPTMAGPQYYNSVFYCPGCKKLFTTANFGLPLSAGKCAEFDPDGDYLLLQNELFKIEMFGADVIDPR